MKQLLQLFGLSETNTTNREPHYKLTIQEHNTLFQKLGQLLHDKHLLEQSIRTQQGDNRSENEQIFLEIIDIIDTIEPILKYLELNPEPEQKFINKRLPKSIKAIQKKLINILSNRQVNPLIVNEGEQPDFNKCRVIEQEIRDDLDEQTITKITRVGYSIEDRILRPTEIITSKKP